MQGSKVTGDIKKYDAQVCSLTFSVWGVKTNKKLHGSYRLKYWPMYPTNVLFISTAQVTIIEKYEKYRFY